MTNFPWKINLSNALMGFLIVLLGEFLGYIVAVVIQVF